MITEVLAIIEKYDLEKDVFMYLFRNSDKLCEQLDVEDRKEVFLSVLLGAKDITPELLAELGAEYNVEIKAEVNED